MLTGLAVRHSSASLMAAGTLAGTDSDLFPPPADRFNGYLVYGNPLKVDYDRFVPIISPGYRGPSSTSAGSGGSRSSGATAGPSGVSVTREREGSTSGSGGARDGRDGEGKASASRDSAGDGSTASSPSFYRGNSRDQRPALEDGRIHLINLPHGALSCEEGCSVSKLVVELVQILPSIRPLDMCVRLSLSLSFARQRPAEPDSLDLDPLQRPHQRARHHRRRLLDLDHARRQQSDLPALALVPPHARRQCARYAVPSPRSPPADDERRVQEAARAAACVSGREEGAACALVGLLWALNMERLLLCLSLERARARERRAESKSSPRPGLGPSQVALPPALALALPRHDGVAQRVQSRVTAGYFASERT